MANRPTPQIFSDYGNLIVKSYNPGKKATNSRGQEIIIDEAQVYTDLGDPELNKEQEKHSFRIRAYSAPARAVLKAAAAHLENPDGREAPVRRLKHLLETKIRTDERPTVPQRDEAGNYVKDENGKTKQVENPYYLAKEAVHRLTTMVRDNEINNTMVRLSDTFKIDHGVSKTGKEYTIARPAAYIKGALIFPACASIDPKRENGKPYNANGRQGRIIDFLVDNVNLRMFVPQERLNDKKYQQIFDYIDNAETKAPMVVNMSAPLYFDRRAPLDENGKPKEGELKRVLQSHLGLASFIEVVDTPALKVKEKDDEKNAVQVSEVPTDDMDDFSMDMNQAF